MSSFSYTHVLSVCSVSAGCAFFPLQAAGLRDALRWLCLSQECPQHPAQGGMLALGLDLQALHFTA